MALQSLNPTTGRVEQRFDPLDAAAIEQMLEHADRARPALAALGFAARAALMHSAGDLLDADADALGRMIVAEMGKPLAQAVAEVRKSARLLHYYADAAEGFLAPQPLADPASVGADRAYTVYQPLGTVLAVMPWNYPIWQVVRFAAPALMAGNPGILKHASNVPRSALYLGDLFARAGFPVGAFQTALVGADAVEAILRDGRVVAATLTGSEPAGRSVAAIAGSEIKRVVLELGGSDPFVVMPSADIDAAVRVGVTARTSNNGQACINAKRFIIHTDVYDEYVEKFTSAMRALTVGDPLAEGTDIGPLATEQGRTDVAALVDDALAHGATARCGGAVPEGDGWFYPPTVIEGVTPAARLYGEEVFGPVAAMYRVADLDEAIALANGTRFGLGAAAWTQDAREIAAFADRLEAGCVNINDMTLSFQNMPFGGVKSSGYGRELAAAGIREFCNLKSVRINRGE